MSDSKPEQSTENGVYDADDTEDCGHKYGWFYSKDSEMVWNPQSDGSGPLIIDKDGEVEDRYLGRAMRKRGQGRGGLWGRLAPVEIDGMEIRQNTKLWHDDREVWLRAVEIDLIEEPDVEPRITFKVEGTSPQTFLKYPAHLLVELREEGTIESQKEVNDRAEQALEQFRASKGADS